MAWLFLVIAGLLEVVWAIGLKYTEGFTRLWPTVGTLSAMAVSMWLLSVALRTLPVGTGYAVWTGIGIVGASILGMVLFNESRDVVRIVALLMIVGGIVLLRVHEAVQSSRGEPAAPAAVAEQPAAGGHADVQPGGEHGEAHDTADEHEERAGVQRAQDAAGESAQGGSAHG